MVKLTAVAYDKIHSIIENEQNPGDKLYLRATMGIGWGGPQLKLSLEEEPLGEDTVVTFEDIDILIHKRDEPYFDNTKIDISEDVFGKKKFILLKV